MASIFISYRRSESQDRTRPLYDRLTAKFGRDGVFIDIDSIPIDSDFPMEANGARRLYNPQDFVRLEVEPALRHDVPVVPVLVGGSAMPDGKRLPETLRPLCRRHAIQVGDDARFDGDVDHLAPIHVSLLGRFPR
jgi:hypothetical protein